jgi:AbrB family looped-hinge helix DNA binding protein
MAVATLTSKGQVTIPVEVRRKLRLKPGDRIDFVVEAGGEVRLRAKKRPLVDLLGVLRGAVKRPLSIEQMHDVILEAAHERSARLRSQRD